MLFTALVTSFVGLPLVMERFRALGLPHSVKKHLCFLQRSGKSQEADYVESFISVFAVGGDCVADFERVRQDEGLKKLGLRAPSPMSARWFLNAFHQVEPPRGRLPHEVFIPEETELLRG